MLMVPSLEKACAGTAMDTPSFSKVAPFWLLTFILVVFPGRSSPGGPTFCGTIAGTFCDDPDGEVFDGVLLCGELEGEAFGDGDISCDDPDGEASVDFLVSPPQEILIQSRETTRNRERKVICRLFSFRV